MVPKKSIPESEFNDFINDSSFLEFYYFLYKSNQMEDTIIDRNIQQLEKLIQTNAYQKIRRNAKRKMLAAGYNLSFSDYMNLRAIKEFTQRLEIVLQNSKLL